MRVLGELPLYVVSAAVLVNLILGIITGVGFSALMVRSIIVTVVFTVLGHVMSEVFSKAVYQSRLNQENLNAAKNGTAIDIQVPPMDDELMSSLSQQEDDDAFMEVNPAYINRYKQANKGEDQF